MGNFFGELRSYLARENRVCYADWLRDLHIELPPLTRYYQEVVPYLKSLPHFEFKPSTSLVFWREHLSQMQYIAPWYTYLPAYMVALFDTPHFSEALSELTTVDLSTPFTGVLRALTLLKRLDRPIHAHVQGSLVSQLCALPPSELAHLKITALRLRTAGEASYIGVPKPQLDWSYLDTLEIGHNYDLIASRLLQQVHHLGIAERGVNVLVFQCHSIPQMRRYVQELEATMTISGAFFKELHLDMRVTLSSNIWRKTWAIAVPPSPDARLFYDICQASIDHVEGEILEAQSRAGLI